MIPFTFGITIYLLQLLSSYSDNHGSTTVLKWQDGKKGAVTLTFDDGSINQFRIAMPIMDSLGLPGTFYIVTGGLEGSQYKPKFVGRSMDDILAEALTIPTDKDNFFERASAIGYLPYKGTLDYHYKAGTLYEQGKIEEAYRTIDEAYDLVNRGLLPSGEDISNELAETAENSWEDFRRYAEMGHEFGSHTITHPRLAVLDEANLLYELEKSKDDILTHLGESHTFSAEGPFGTEDERVMEKAYEIYPALRNRMPHDFLEELNRSSRKDPALSEKGYVQWQRGPLRDVLMETMKSWLETTITSENVWLVLVFHGVEGIGWEPRTEEELKEYFSYIQSKEEDLWVGTFKDVTKYIRERMASEITIEKEKDSILITLSHGLDPSLYNYPLTLKTYIPAEWKQVSVRQGEQDGKYTMHKDGEGTYIQYLAIPNGGKIMINAK